MGGIRVLLRMGIAMLVFAAGAESMAASGPKDLVLKGDAKCTTCHDESDAPRVLQIGRTRHGTIADARVGTCTSCHGESDTHIASAEKGTKPITPPDVTFGRRSKNTPDDRSKACLSCHQGGNRIHWASSTHASRDVTCASCHEIHTQHDRARDKKTQTEACFTCHTEQRAQVNRPSHHPIVEGLMTCSSCHNVHGDNPKQLLRASTNEVCFTCHMEKRGPFVHNHAPVQENCAICHNPHGTVANNLLRQRLPFLCQECHSHTSHPSQLAGLPTGRTTSTSALGAVARGCTNCHVNIHGSNSTQNSATSGRFRR